MKGDLLAAAVVIVVVAVGGKEVGRLADFAFFEKEIRMVKWEIVYLFLNLIPGLGSI